MSNQVDEPQDDELDVDVEYDEGEKKLRGKKGYKRPACIVYNKQHLRYEKYSSNLNLCPKPFEAARKFTLVNHYNGAMIVRWIYMFGDLNDWWTFVNVFGGNFQWQKAPGKLKIYKAASSQDMAMSTVLWVRYQIIIDYPFSIQDDGLAVG